MRYKWNFEGRFEEPLFTLHSFWADALQAGSLPVEGLEACREGGGGDGDVGTWGERAAGAEGAARAALA